MAIRNPQPAVIDGITYDLLGVALCMSTRPQDERMALSIAVTFYPYRDTSTGPEYLDQGQSSLVFGDATEQAKSLPALAQFLAALEAAGQAFVNEVV